MSRGSFRAPRLDPRPRVCGRGPHGSLSTLFLSKFRSCLETRRWVCVGACRGSGPLRTLFPSGTVMFDPVAENFNLWDPAGETSRRPRKAPRDSAHTHTRFSTHTRFFGKLIHSVGSAAPPSLPKKQHRHAHTHKRHLPERERERESPFLSRSLRAVALGRASAFGGGALGELWKRF